MSAVDALPLFEAEARERQRDLGRQAAKRRHHLERVEANLPQTTHRAPQARDRAAAATGVSGRTVQTAKAIKEKAPDLAERVSAGKMSVHAAVREVQRRELAPIIKAQVERDRRELQELADEINPPDFDRVENADPAGSVGSSRVSAATSPSSWRPRSSSPARGVHLWVHWFDRVGRVPEP